MPRIPELNEIMAATRIEKLFKKRSFYLTVLTSLLLFPCETKATAGPGLDEAPRLHWNAAFSAASGTAGRMPLWQVSHRGGRFMDRRTDGYIAAGLHLGWRIPSNTASSNPPVERNLFRLRRDYTPWYAWRLDYRAGLELIGKTVPGESRIYEAYMQLRFGPFEITGGRLPYVTGFPDSRLSSGSLGMSSNFAPFPRVTAGIPDFIPIPFTFGFLEIKGQYTHGWIDDDRFTSNPWLHEKNAFAQTRSDWPLRFRGGFTHFAFWGGEHPEFGKVPSRFQDYLRVIFARSADPDFEGSENFQPWRDNAIGDHLGVIEFAIAWNLLGAEWEIYRQFLFEDGSGMRFYYNKDGLNGLRIQPGSRWISTVLFEFLGTAWQSGPGPHDPPVDPDDPFYDPDEPYFDPDYPYNFGGRDDYYNHYIFQNGWSYRGHSMGSPLLLLDSRARFYYPDAQFGRRRFASNRVKAWHLGLEGNLGGLSASGSGLVSKAGNILSDYRLMITRAKHQGLYTNIDIFNQTIDPDAPFAGSPLQYHMILEFSGQLPLVQRLFSGDRRAEIENRRIANADGRDENRRIANAGGRDENRRIANPRRLVTDLHWTAAISWDTGELANHAGFMIGLRWGMMPIHPLK